MKAIKRILATVTAVVMMAAMMVAPASADEPVTTYTIKISNTADNHTFEAYQIFTGDLSGRILSNIQWGTGVDSGALLTALKADATLSGKFTSCTDAAEVATVLESETWTNTDTDAFAKVVNKHLKDSAKYSTTGTTAPYTFTLPAGYYFIKDVTTLSGTTNDAITKYMIEVTENATISPKVVLPTLTKAVSSTVDGTYSEAISACTGSLVYFKLTASLNTRVNDYPEYYLQFVDTLPTGLTFNAVESVKVSGHSISFAANEYGFAFQNTPAAGTDPEVTTFTLAQAKTAVTTKTGAAVNATDTVEVIFSCNVTNDINLNAVGGNTNTVQLKYSNNPNTTTETYDDTLSTSLPASAKVYSYQMVVEKIDAASTSENRIPLAGAQFILYYKVDTTSYYAQVTNNYVTGWTTDRSLASPLTSASNGQIAIKGLNKNTYYLEETKAPETYNKNSDIVDVTIQATFNKETGSVTGFSADLTGHGIAQMKSGLDGINPNTGTVSFYITNSKGATLPETGGMGTTIFYIAGAVLMIGAATVLVTKKRGSQK